MIPIGIGSQIRANEMSIFLWLANSWQAAPSLGTLPQWVESVGVVSALVWFLWYEKSVAEPRRMEAGAVERQKLREDYLAQTKLLVAAYQENSKKEATDDDRDSG